MKLVVDNNSRLYALRETPRFEYNGQDSYMVWTLIPVAIYDYVDPDYSEKQGWLQEIPHTGSIDYEEIVQYVVVESLKDALEDFGYTFIDVNTIYIWGEGNERPTANTAETAVANAFDLW